MRTLRKLQTTYDGLSVVSDHVLAIAVCAGYLNGDRGWFGVAVSILLLGPIVETVESLRLSGNSELHMRIAAAVVTFFWSCTKWEMISCVFEMWRGESVEGASEVIAGHKERMLFWTNIPTLFLTTYIVILQFATQIDNVPTALQGASIVSNILQVAIGISATRWRVGNYGASQTPTVWFTAPFQLVTIMWSFFELAARALAFAFFAAGYKAWVFVALVMEVVARLCVIRLTRTKSGYTAPGEHILKAVRQTFVHEVVRARNPLGTRKRLLAVLCAAALQAFLLLAPSLNDYPQLASIRPAREGSGLVPVPFVSGLCWGAAATRPLDVFSNIQDREWLRQNCNHLASNGTRVPGKPFFETEEHRIPGLLFSLVVMCIVLSILSWTVWECMDSRIRAIAQAEEQERQSSRAREKEQVDAAAEQA